MQSQFLLLLSVLAVVRGVCSLPVRAELQELCAIDVSGEYAGADAGVTLISILKEVRCVSEPEFSASLFIWGKTSTHHHTKRSMAPAAIQAIAWSIAAPFFLNVLFLIFITLFGPLLSDALLLYFKRWHWFHNCRILYCPRRLWTRHEIMCEQRRHKLQCFVEMMGDGAWRTRFQPESEERAKKALERWGREVVEVKRPRTAWLRGRR